MKRVDIQYTGAKLGENGAPPAAWRVAPLQPVIQPRRTLSRLLRREEPSTFHRCLAVHLYFASARGGLS